MVLIECIIMNNCRLCHSKPGLYELNADKKLVQEIFDCIKIKVNDKSMDLLPKCVCEECQKTVKNFFLYKQRVRKVDQSLRKILTNKESNSSDNDNFKKCLNEYKCQKCPATFSIQNLFKNHLKSHSSKWNETYSESKFDADLCKRELNCFKYNKESVNVNESRTDSCSVEISNTNTSQEDCGKDIKQENTQDSTEDIKKLSEVSKGHLNCNICKQNFNTVQDLRIHNKSHKTKFICSWKNCQKVLNSPYTLKTHELKHEGTRSFLCVTCGKGFITKNSLTCHEKIHLDVKAYSCKLCNIGFSVRSNLRAHEKKHHEGIRFYCSQCTKAFVSKCSLERHERIHTGIKEFQCESCPSAFYTNKELVKHQRYHQGLRLHKCDECFKTFFERHHLVIHLRSHTGERPYVCKVPNCGKSFMESQKLKRHYNAKHAQT